MEPKHLEHGAEIERLNAKVLLLTRELEKIAASTAALTAISLEIPNLTDMKLLETYKYIDRILGTGASAEQKAEAYSIVDQLQKRARLTMNSPDNLR